MANNSNRKAIRFMVQGALPPHDVNVLWMDTSIKDVPILKIFEKGAWIAVQNPAEYEPLKPGDNITIENNVISAIQPDVSNFVTKEELDEAIDNVEEDVREVSDSIPKVKNELIYSDDNETLTSYPLLYEEGLIVSTPEDLALCKERAEVTMSAVYSSWNPYGYNSDDRGKWGHCDSVGTGSTKTVTLVDNTTQTVPIYKYNGEPQGYIFNTKNTSFITGYYSNSLYSYYDNIVAVGIIPSLKSQGATDYMAVIPALYGDSNVFCGISVSANNTISTSTDGRETVGSEAHTISVVAWSQASPNTPVSGSTGAVQILKNQEGQRISKYNSALCNGTANGTASTIQLRIQRRGNILTFWASDPYPTTDDDYIHRSDIHLDCPITINLDKYTLQYTYKNASNEYVTITKDFSDTSTPPSGYTTLEAQIVKNTFTAINGSAKRGYEVCSNPGSIFRNVTTDEIILDVTPGENKVYKFNGNTWEVLNTTPQLQLKSGSRIAWNRITNKLFYNNGATIKQIAGDDNSGTYNIGKWCKEDSNSILNIGIGTGENDLKNALQIASNGNIYVFGIGGYDGTNADSVEVQSLQQYLQSL